MYVVLRACGKLKGTPGQKAVMRLVRCVRLTAHFIMYNVHAYYEETRFAVDVLCLLTSYKLYM